MWKKKSKTHQFSPEEPNKRLTLGKTRTFVKSMREKKSDALVGRV
jgi:hypothetical protein